MSASQTRTIYLEMLSAPDLPADDELSVRPLGTSAVAEYREIYDIVGGPFRWTRRVKMSERELGELLATSGVETWVLEVDGQSAGFAELDCRSDDAEIVYFGLAPAFIGQGLGKRFLRWVIRHVWSKDPRRLWLHTCDRDHPAALPNYQKAGFVVYDEEMIEVDDE